MLWYTDCVCVHTQQNIHLQVFRCVYLNVMLKTVGEGNSLKQI